MVLLGDGTHAKAKKKKDLGISAFSLIVMTNFPISPSGALCVAGCSLLLWSVWGIPRREGGKLWFGGISISAIFPYFICCYLLLTIFKLLFHVFCPSRRDRLTSSDLGLKHPLFLLLKTTPAPVDKYLDHFYLLANIYGAAMNMCEHVLL